MNDENTKSVGDILRFWRQHNRLSQIDLAATAEISAKHLSFVETGKARPSYQLLQRLVTILDLPLRHKNSLFLAGGFAPPFTRRNLNSPDMEVIQQALQRILDKHEPYPALVITKGYDIVLYNKGFTNVLAALGKSASLNKYNNLYRLVFAPDGLQPHFPNWPQISSLLKARLWEEAVTSSNNELIKLHQEISQAQPVHRRQEIPKHVQLPVLSFSLVHDRLMLSFFSTMTTFGTPLDVTVEELRIESLFPTDLTTQNWLNDQA